MPANVIGRREALFHVDGATWFDNNCSVFVTEHEALVRLMKALYSAGYREQENLPQEAGTYGYVFRVVDSDGRNYGRAGGGENYSVQVHYLATNGSRLPYEAIYRLADDKHWQTLEYSGKSTWHGEANVPYYLIPRKYPEAEYVVRPTWRPV